MRLGSLFSGFGGLDLGFEMAGMEVVWQVEKEEYPQGVLAKHWKEVPKFDEIKKTHGIFSHPNGIGKISALRKKGGVEEKKAPHSQSSSRSTTGHDIRSGDKESCCEFGLPPVDIIAGGFPCQPFSVAGRRKGTADDRHLWPEMLRVISELKPTWVVGENVTNIIPLFLDQAISDLEAEGYAVEPFVLPACAFDTYHRRDRLFIVGYPQRYASRWSIRRGDYAPEGIPQPNRSQNSSPGQSRRTSAVRGTNQGYVQNSGRQHGTGAPDEGEYPGENRTGHALHAERSDPPSRFIAQPWGRPIDEREFFWQPEPDVGRMADGVPSRVERLRGLGNAVVPQQAEFVGQLIMAADEIFRSLE